LSKKLYPY